MTEQTTPALAPMPGVALITYPDGTTRYEYTDELQAAIDRAETAGYAPVVQTITTPAPVEPAARPALIEPWMVRGAAGLGLAGGTVALAPIAASAVGAMSAALGDLLHLALQVGGAGLAAFVLLRLLTGRKAGGQGVEVVQTVTQTITNVVRIEK
jgi:hypothetical protein